MCFGGVPAVPKYQPGKVCSNQGRKDELVHAGTIAWAQTARTKEIGQIWGDFEGLPPIETRDTTVIPT